jgi:predicted acetyltransferase
VRGHPGGFALVDEAGAEDNASGGHCVADFFVLRSYRRHGYGLALAHALFDRFAGRWVIEQLPDEVDATAFWRRAIRAYVGERFADAITETDYVHVRQTFDTRDRVTL